MNILISCPGMMYATVELLRREFARAGYGTIATGNSYQIAGLYAADKAYIVPAIDDDDYIPHLLAICGQNQVKAVMTFLDRDIIVLSQAEQEFRNKGIMPLVVDHEAARICDHKYRMYEFLAEHGFRCAHTFASPAEFRAALERDDIAFPVIAKPAVGDGSRGVIKCFNLNEIERAAVLNPDLIIQEYLDGPEYDVDLYVDTISKKMISVFAKQKLVNAIGGTITGVSMHDEKLFALTGTLAQRLDLAGALNMEIFELAGEYYIGEVNPRFGASYIGAYACGVNFAPLILNNINGLENQADSGDYPDGACMMKYTATKKITPGERISVGQARMTRGGQQ